MSETMGWGCSLVKNPVQAGQEAARSALEQLKGRECKFCLVFSTVGYPVDVLLDNIKKETGSVPMTGCSGEGGIAPGIADESNHCVVVLASADDRIRINTVGLADVSDSSAAGRNIGEELKPHLSEDSRCVMVYPCGLNVVADEFIENLEREVGKELPIIGGSAGDNHLRVKTFQFHDWKTYEGGVSAALLSGDFSVITDVTHGCVPIGNEMEITKVDQNHLYEIDHRAAMDVMVDYVGGEVRTDFGKVSVHFCIGQKSGEEFEHTYDPYIIRYIAKHHPETKSIVLPIKMEKGDKIWITRRDQNKMIRAAGRSIENILQKADNRKPFFVLHYDCAGRGNVIFSEQDKLSIIESLQQSIAPEMPWVGFFTYGEFCPIGTKNTFHNFSAAIVAFVSRESSNERPR